MRKAIAIFCLILPLILLNGCRKEPLTREKAQDLIEASNEFQPQSVHVTLTAEELKKGTDAGYWYVSGIKRSDSALPTVQMLLLTPIGATLFRGASPMTSPRMAINQKLNARVIEITKIEEDPSDPKGKNVEFTWTRRFENEIPELAELFKDQPAQPGTKKFRYGTSGWELVP